MFRSKLKGVHNWEGLNKEVFCNKFIGTHGSWQLSGSASVGQV